MRIFFGTICIAYLAVACNAAAVASDLDSLPSLPTLQALQAKNDITPSPKSNSNPSVPTYNTANEPSSLGQKAYAQLSSLTTQLPSPHGDTPIIMESVDAILNLDVSADHKQVTVKTDGIYFIMAAVQAGSAAPGVKGWLDIWSNLNNQMSPNSNARYAIQTTSDTVVLVSQSVSPLKAGDQISVGFAASGPSLGIIYTKPENQPAIPSIIFTLFKID